VLALYIFSLILSGGLFGLFCRDLLSQIGYLPGFSGGIAVAMASALLYACVEVLYVALLRLIKPTKTPGYLFMEVLSHLSALILLPYILHVAVPWPHPILEKVDSAIFFSVFLLFHVLFKLASFYACLRATPAGRGGALGWIGVSSMLLLTSWLAFNAWLGTMADVRNQTPDSYHLADSGGVFVMAAPLVEGGEAVWNVAPKDDESLYVQLAPQGGASQVYVTVTAEGAESRKITELLSLSEHGWTTLKLTPEQLPPRTHEMRLSWRTERDPIWERALNLPPVILWDSNLLISKPAIYGPTGPETGPNIVVVLLEGLSAEHMSLLGYPRQVTPSLDAAAKSNVWFSQLFSPAPDASDVLATVLSGGHPLALAPNGELPYSLAAALSERGYATAAFLEGANDGEDPARLGPGFARLDTSYDSEAGSAATLERAREWLTDHQDVRHFAIVRLSELADPVHAARYGQGFLNPDADEQTARDIYDSALLYLDNELGRWLHELESGSGSTRLCYAVTAPYGLDFSPADGLPVAGLTEQSLHVPLILRLPSKLRVQRDDLCSLQQLGCALRGLGHVDGAGVGVMDVFGAEQVISATVEPLVLSVRNDTWRFTYDTGLTLGRQRQKDAQPVSLFYVGSSPDAVRGQNVLGQHAAVAQRLTQELEQWLEWVPSSAFEPCATPKP
jgi:hypothetical protein